MDPQQARRYVRHLRYLYQDLLLFGCVSFVCYGVTFSWGKKIVLLLMSWGVSLWARESQFNLIDGVQSSIAHLSHKWEDYKNSSPSHPSSSKDKP